MAVAYKTTIAFSLVSIPVSLYTATQDTDIRFNQLCKQDHSRVRYKKVCPSCGNEVTNEDIVKGFEYDISVTSGGKHISAMGGKVTIHAPYELRPGERPEHIIVYYVDDNGRRERCETSYDSAKKRVNWKTDHLSVYMIDYDESLTNETNLNPATGANANPNTGGGVPSIPPAGNISLTGLCITLASIILSGIAVLFFWKRSAG